MLALAVVGLVALAAALLVALAVLSVRGVFSPPWHLPTHTAGTPLTRSMLPAAWGSVVSDPREEFGIAFEEVEVDGPCGRTLRGWFVPARGGARPDVCLLMVHGAGRDRRAWLRHLPVFQRAGYPCLLFDCSGHGASDGRGLGVSYCGRESMDVLAAARWLRGSRGFLRVALLGTSQGAASSLVAASVAGPEQGVVAVVAENPFYESGMLLGHVLGVVRHRFLPRPLSLLLAPFWPLWVAVVRRFVLWRMRRMHGAVRAGSEASEDAAALVVGEAMDGSADGTLSPSGTLHLVRQPLLVMHSESDFLIPAEHSRRVHAAAVSATHRDLWIVDGADHCALYDAFPAEWEARVVGFLRRFAPLGGGAVRKRNE